MFIIDVLKAHAQQMPNQAAIIFQQNEWTYEELYEKAKTIAAYLQQQGYKKGDIVAQFTLNSDLFMAIYYGIQLAGLTVMPVNTKLAAPEVAYIFRHSKAKILIYDEQLEETIQATDASFEEVLTLADLRKALQEDTWIFTELVAQEDETAVVMYTSGTTGKPKGVMLSHCNIFETAEIWSDSMQMTTSDRMYIVKVKYLYLAVLVLLIVVTFYQQSTVKNLKTQVGSNYVITVRSVLNATKDVDEKTLTDSCP